MTAQTRKSIDECKAILANKGMLHHEGIGPTLVVWVIPDGIDLAVPEAQFRVPSEYFRELSEYQRELRLETKPERPLPIAHIRTPESGAVHSYGYCPNRQIFEVRYKHAPTILYTFAQVPTEVFEACQKAESLGRFLSATFPKGQTKYPMTKEDDAKPIGDGGYAESLKIAKKACEGEPLQEAS